MQEGWFKPQIPTHKGLRDTNFLKTENVIKNNQGKTKVMRTKFTLVQVTITEFCQSSFPLDPEISLFVLFWGSGQFTVDITSIKLMEGVRIRQSLHPVTLGSG